MTPSIDDRLDSIIRSLSTIILPSLPETASLAKEQVELVLGHLQIMQSQLDESPAFEREELDDVVTLAKELAALKNEPALADNAARIESLAFEAENISAPSAVREARISLHSEVDALIKQVFAKGSQEARAILKQAVFQSEELRIVKDRAMLAAFGFDS